MVIKRSLVDWDWASWFVLFRRTRALEESDEISHQRIVEGHARLATRAGDIESAHIGGP